MYYTKSYKIGVYVLIKFNLVEKDISKKLFLLQNNSYFFFFEKARRKSKQKEETFTISYNLTVMVWMDVAGEPALSRSLKNARGATVAHF